MACPICDDGFSGIIDADGGKTTFECATCGRFAVSGSAMPALTHLSELSGVKRAAISHQTRLATLEGKVPLITTYELDGLIANAQLPSPAVQALNLIRFVGLHISETGKPLREFPLDKRSEYLTSIPLLEAGRIGTHETRNGKIVDTTAETIASQRENLAEIERILRAE